ncbi:lantibiotic dehydratase family protein [Flavobacterium sp. HJJ]|uniref:lantibiotic dehydratase family protein n=1 Tax=Flavobacterium sp. HJJ TaxID=2783792 RepID=UPI001889D51C|nr:lantibiotic dehydratase family protein [Flavobacterium sp. HJJ]MBF4472437.1 lantibiotic dehydratase family protein [Flavobacterium sp. HJJ]
MKINNPYEAFPEYVLRAPLISYSFYKNITQGKDISDEVFKSLFKEKFINEAIFLATPILYEELKKWVNDEVTDLKKIEKLKISFLKYFSRMSSRCTPFGLFAGCAMGKFGEYSEISLNDAKNNNRHTRLDMNYLVALSQDFVKNNILQEQIKFFPNSSLYKMGKQFRYVEYRYVEGIREHEIIAIENSIYLEKVLKASVNGILKHDIVQLLIDEENSKEAVLDFVEELIENQVLISELEPSVSGPEFLDQIKKVLYKVQGIDFEKKILKDVEYKLSIIDQKVGSDVEKYMEIGENLKKIETQFDIKYLFQTDVILKPESNVLDKTIINSIKKGLSIFNKLTLVPKNDNLSTFKNAFNERYEESEISLSKALDVEIGIGYKQNQEGLDINPLIDDLIFPSTENKNMAREIKWSQTYSFFQKKLIDSFINGDYIITITENDFEFLSEDWKDLPDTISTIVEIVKIKGQRKIVISGAGGSSSANLLGRFCHGDLALKKFTERIVDLEKKMNSDKILAEINHLPESRVGNILMRPNLRDFEIPYLANSTLVREKQLEIEDLLISVKNQKIILRSNRHNMEVIPRLSNAHNYSGNSLPIYHFLSDMQNQNKRASIGFDLGPFANEYSFIPRIEYCDLILSEATWNINKEEIKSFFGYEDSDLLFNISLWRNKNKIPQKVLLVDSDNELLINLENVISIKMFLNTVKNRNVFKIKEFLFTDDGIVRGTDPSEYYTNQIVVSFFNKERLKNE